MEEPLYGSKTTVRCQCRWGGGAQGVAWKAGSRGCGGNEAELGVTDMVG